MTTRYDPHGVETEFEPGSRGRVLRNALGIIRVRDMQLAESQALWLAQRQAIDTFSEDHRFTAEDIRSLHRMWLGPIYPWAGEYRSVNIGKGGFQFAGAHLIPRLMSKLERGVLARFTPCQEPEAAEALAAVHAELILIHPFRDGNGRLARLLALLMGLQAGFAAAGFFTAGWTRQEALHHRHPCRHGARLPAAGGGIRTDYRADPEARRFQ